MKRIFLACFALLGITLCACDNTTPTPPAAVGQTAKATPSPSPTPDPRIAELTDRLGRLAAQVTQTIEREKQSVETAINNFTPTLTQHRNEMKINEKTSHRDAAERNLRESEKTMAKLEGKRDALAALSPKVTDALAAPEPSPSGSVGGAR